MYIVKWNTINIRTPHGLELLKLAVVACNGLQTVTIIPEAVKGVALLVTYLIGQQILFTLAARELAIALIIFALWDIAHKLTGGVLP